METTPSPAAVTQPGTYTGELLTTPATYNGAPAVGLLTPEEAASGCRLYVTRNNAHAPAMQMGDYLVARPLAPEQWAEISDDSYCVLLRQYPADEEDGSEAFQAHHIARIVGNGFRYGGLLLSFYDDTDSVQEATETEAVDLLEVWHITRSFRPL
ncbi:hypothetical protein [Hymenobacter perfusus]|uniref:Uncharacterized protein n=1 Tax=Hymenobacter perfusus TaxID=1236770 RepID=A0A3R9MQK2_9BACT|nr:hypothetical protein [Hymenobacter perfusus]RSK46107.1 hypothetical protein EI293_02755 [Hymenobacter perfusus]